MKNKELRPKLQHMDKWAVKRHGFIVRLLPAIQQLSSLATSGLATAANQEVCGLHGFTKKMQRRALFGSDTQLQAIYAP